MNYLDTECREIKPEKRLKILKKDVLKGRWPFFIIKVHLEIKTIQLMAFMCLMAE